MREKELRAAITAAEAGAVVIRRYFATGVAVDGKSDDATDPPGAISAS